MAKFLGPFGDFIGSYLGKWFKGQLGFVIWGRLRSQICNALPATKLEQEEMRVVGGIGVLVKLVG